MVEPSHSVTPDSVASDCAFAGEATVHRARLLAADAAFRQALPDLMKAHLGQWVAYHGDRRLGIYDSKPAAYEACRAAGLATGQCLIDAIEPIEDEQVLGVGVGAPPDTQQP